MTILNTIHGRQNRKGAKMEIIALMNQKGGVGKTTSAVNIGAGLGRIGRKVLLIDLDPQAHATLSLGFPREMTKTSYELLTGTKTAADDMTARDGLTVIPSSLQLAGAEMQLIGLPGREMLLKSALAPIRADFDYILIDCPPSIGVLTMNALAAATAAFVPVMTEYLPTQGISQLTETVDLIRTRLNPRLSIKGVFGTFYDSRRTVNREVMDHIRQTFGAAVFETVIRSNIALSMAPGQGKTIFEYAPSSHGAADYLALCQEIVSREGVK